ncbi:MAG: sulfotransferase domain-containing protein, partial [Polymorphobacter sp.]
SPWLDLRVPRKAEKLPMIEAQTHRRFIKTHLLVDALVFGPRAKCPYIGRDGRDVVGSLYNHHFNADATWYDALNNVPGRVGPPIELPPADIRQYWRDWADRDGHAFWPFWENIRSWRAIRDLPNVKLVHFEDLKR